MSRLIDADAIKLEKGFFENIDNVPKFYEWLGKQPTIDAVEVVHGEWIMFERPNGGYYKGCSLCTYPMPTDMNLDYLCEEDNRFCYNCGAKMDATQSNDSNVLDALDGKEENNG